MTDTTTEWTPERRKIREAERAGALALLRHKRYTYPLGGEPWLGDDAMIRLVDSVLPPPPPETTDDDACLTCGHAPTKHAGFHLTETCRCPRTEEAK